MRLQAKLTEPNELLLMGVVKNSHTKTENLAACIQR